MNGSYGSQEETASGRGTTMRTYFDKCERSLMMHSGTNEGNNAYSTRSNYLEILPFVVVPVIVLGLIRGCRGRCNIGRFTGRS